MRGDRRSGNEKYCVGAFRSTRHSLGKLAEIIAVGIYPNVFVFATGKGGVLFKDSSVLIEDCTCDCISGAEIVLVCCGWVQIIGGEGWNTVVIIVVRIMFIVFLGWGLRRRWGELCALL